MRQKWESAAKRRPLKTESNNRFRARLFSIIYNVARSALMTAREHLSLSASGEFAEMLGRAESRLGELEEEFTSTTLDARKLEQSLTGLERMLSDVLANAVEPERLAALEQEVKGQLQPYKKQMDAAVYEQTFENLLLKRLRDQFAVPRLSLFYL